jgi:phosphoglycolate phosphatase
MTIRAVIFDLDGTLVDTLDDITACVNACLESLGDAARSREEVRGMVGDGVELLCRRALARVTDERVLEMAHCMRTRYREHLIESSAPYEGVVPLLHALSSRGIRLAVLSNKPHELTKRHIEELFDEGLFEIVQGQEDGFPLKPDPGGLLWVIDRLDLSRGECLFVGDSQVDVRTGLAAGVRTLAAAWGFRTPAELAGAHRLIHVPEEVLHEISK